MLRVKEGNHSMKTRLLAALRGKSCLVTYIHKLRVSFPFHMTLQYYGTPFYLRQSRRYLD